MKAKAKDIASRRDHHKQLGGLRKLLNSFLFDMHTTRGQATNAVTLIVIILAVLLSMLNTIDSIHMQWGSQIDRFEYWVLALFAVEHGFRVYAARNRLHYMRSFDGIIDLMTILPLFVLGNSYVLMRLLRLVRVIKLAISMPVVRMLFLSLKGSVQLLLGVLVTIGLISIFIGNAIFILEPQTYANAFEGAWWALVTMSTVGYGDFVPQSPLGKVLAAGLILSGICMFAMVTAVISIRVGRMVNYMRRCPVCHVAHSPEYAFCPHCAAPQEPQQAFLMRADDE